MSSGSADLPELEERTTQEVRASTRFLLKSFQGKIDELKSASGAEVQKLMRFGVDQRSAASTAREFFGKDEISYIAIDGTKGEDQHLDLLVFYVGAFGYTGALSLAGDEIRIGEPTPMTSSSTAVSASIPLSEEDAATVFGQRSESGTEVDVERLPSALMHLAEYYIAVNALASGQRPGVVILDRSLAGDISHLTWSTRELVRSHHCVLEAMATPFGQVTNLDLELARQMVRNPDLKIPPPRSHLLKFAALAALSDGSALSLEDVLTRLALGRDHLPVLENDLADLDTEFHLFEPPDGAAGRRFKLKPGVEGFWRRVLAAAHLVADHIFEPKGDHPLRLVHWGGGRWITASDLDYLVLVLCLEILRKAWSDNILPIGLIKDTAASELVRAVVPMLRSSGLEEFGHDLPNFNSDKMLLQTNSVVNALRVPTPWHTIDMDAAFRTMVPVPDGSLHKGEARAVGAYRNVINPERMLVKTYIQLWSSKSDPTVRSHVFTFDRPAFAAYDRWGDMVVHNKDNEVDERISPILDLHEGSPMTNLSMAVLSEMSQEVVPEALGHNYPLFLADKKAKAVLEQSREAYAGAVKVELAKSELDQQVLFSQRFRDYRSSIESQRKGARR